MLEVGRNNSLHERAWEESQLSIIESGVYYLANVSEFHCSWLSLRRVVGQYSHQLTSRAKRCPHMRDTVFKGCHTMGNHWNNYSKKCMTNWYAGFLIEALNWNGSWSFLKFNTATRFHTNNTQKVVWIFRNISKCSLLTYHILLTNGQINCIHVIQIPFTDNV